MIVPTVDEFLFCAWWGGHVDFFNVLQIEYEVWTSNLLRTGKTICARSIRHLNSCRVAMYACLCVCVCWGENFIYYHHFKSIWHWKREKSTVLRITKTETCMTKVGIVLNSFFVFLCAVRQPSNRSASSEWIDKRERLFSCLFIERTPTTVHNDYSKLKQGKVILPHWCKTRFEYYYSFLSSTALQRVPTY